MKIEEEELDKLRGEWLNDPELAGSCGYCNPKMAEKIFDWFAARTVPKSEVAETLEELELGCPDSHSGLWKYFRRIRGNEETYLFARPQN